MATQDESGATEEPMTQAEFWSAYADWQVAYVECARSYGADAEIIDGNSIRNPVAEGRETADGLDAACVQDVGPVPEAPPASAALLVGMYEGYVEQAACLEAAGYTVSEPPSRAAWVEGYGADSWNPLGDVLATTGSAIQAVGECPEPDPVDAERLGLEVLEAEG